LAINKAKRENLYVDAVTPSSSQSPPSNCTDYHDSPLPGLLIGFDLSYGYLNAGTPIAYIKGLRPVFVATNGGKFVGKDHGPIDEPKTHVEAKPGYAVGRIHIIRGIFLQGILITYMRIGPNGLDPNDSYDSPHYGGPGGNVLGYVGGDGSYVVGIHGLEELGQRPRVYTLGLLTAPRSP
jgi:hypothetical protein